jgi:hypothetical protein
MFAGTTIFINLHKQYECARVGALTSVREVAMSAVSFWRKCIAAKVKLLLAGAYIEGTGATTNRPD